MTGKSRRSKKRPRPAGSHKKGPSSPVSNDAALVQHWTSDQSLATNNYNRRQGTGSPLENAQHVAMASNRLPQRPQAEQNSTSRDSPGNISRSRLDSVSSTSSTRSRVCTLVNGEYIEHDPKRLPEPLGTGFKAWAIAQRSAQNAHTTQWNNRLLKFWRMSTDYSRFKAGEQIEEEEMEAKPERKEVEETSERSHGISAPHMLPIELSLVPPQRPYTAPPHQSE